VQGSALDPLSLNRYLYAAADPETLVDPDGHFAFVAVLLAPEVLGAGAALVAALGSWWAGQQFLNGGIKIGGMPWDTGQPSRPTAAPCGRWGCPISVFTGNSTTALAKPQPGRPDPFPQPIPLPWWADPDRQAGITSLERNTNPDEWPHNRGSNPLKNPKLIGLAAGGIALLAGIALLCGRDPSECGSGDKGVTAPSPTKHPSPHRPTPGPRPPNYQQYPGLKAF